MEALRRRLFLFWTDLFNKTPSTGTNIKSLDGIRGIAVLLVILSHTDGFGMLGQGAVGVWIFFVLSGFLLTTPFSKNPELILNLNHTGKFLFRRLRRIIPLYYIVVVLLAWPIIGLPFVDVLKHFVFIRADWHLWSIPQELLFYLLMPAIFYCGHVFNRLKIRYIFIFLLAISAYLFGKYITVDVFHLNGNGIHQPFYAGPFIVGVATCYLWFYLSKLSVSKSGLVFLQVLGVLILSSFVLTAKAYKHLIPIKFIQSIDYLGWEYPLFFAVLASLLIIISLLYEHGLIGRILSFYPLRSVGVMGYSMYLLHPFIKEMLVRHGGMQLGNGLFFYTLFLTYILSIFTYGFIERTFIKY